MTDLLIECPKCKRHESIMVSVICSMPLTVEDGEACWEWTESEATGEKTQYWCYQCQHEWLPNEKMADDFVVEVSDDD